MASTQLVSPFLEFDEKQHRFFADGEQIPSITQVPNELGMIPTEYFTEEHRRRGTLVHALTEMNDSGKVARWPFDRTKDYTAEEVEEAKLYHAQWKDLRAQIEFEILDVERIVFDPVSMYAGILDRHVRFEQFPQDPALIEIKTNRSGYLPPWTGLQLSAQGNALKPGEIFRRFVAILNPDKFSLIELPIEEYIEDRDNFLCMLRAVRWKRAHS